MGRARPLALAVLALAGATCSKKPEPAPPPPRPGGGAFTLKDLAAATALDARLARLSLVAGDVQQALTPPPEPGAKPGAATAGRARAKELLPALEPAVAEAEGALAGVMHPLDRPMAQAAVAAAREYAGKLTAAAEAADPAPMADLFAARDAFGSTISAYRASRVAWRLEAPDPVGVEREFAEARREMERIESGFGARTRVAPRESGHELEPATARRNGQMAARRARAAAEQLPPPLREAAVRYADAEARALEAFTGLFQAPVAERPARARAYHSAKVEALAALADYFGALAAR